MRCLVTSLLLLISFFPTFGQPDDFSTIFKHDGDSISLKLETIPCNNKEVLYDNQDEDFISGKSVVGVTIEVPKSEIKEIRMRNGMIFEIFKDQSRSYLGSFVTKGTVKIFETFDYHNLSTSIPDGNTGFSLYGSSSVKEGYRIYWEQKEGQLYKTKPQKIVNEVRQSCPALEERLTIFQSLDNKNFAIDNINYYNQVCGNKTPYLDKPCKVILFRKKGGQKNIPVKIRVNGREYSFGRNYLETLEIENAVDVEICDDTKSNCIKKTFSPDRTNFVEISLRNKDTKPTITYVDNAYGALKTKWIKEAMK